MSRMLVVVMTAISIGLIDGTAQWIMDDTMSWQQFDFLIPGAAISVTSLIFILLSPGRISA